jgi:hypothetical protein
MLPHVGATALGNPPEPITALTPGGWWRFNTGITETGQGVSQWSDQSGNSRHLLQSTDGARPPKQSDGSILFNGSDEFLVCGAFTFNQPWTVYFLGKQVTWTTADPLFSGAAAFVNQRTGSPQIGLNAGSALGTVSPALDTYFILTAVGNGASSANRLNFNTAVTGNAGTGAIGTFKVGSNAAGSAFGHIQVKEIVLFGAAHNEATQDSVITYLATVGGLNIQDT